ncbi:MAG: pyruvate dehydrogenase complex dihydrolipoamide acetyltransferase [Polyangiales bacterium]
MAKIIGLPKLSPTMEEGTLVRWAKKEGEAIEVDDLLAEVETDKATMEFRSFDKGVLLKILKPEGETLKPDQPVAIVGQAGEDISALLAQAGGAPAAAPAAPAAAAATPAAAPAPAATAAPAPAPGGDGRVLSSPLVRKLAREQGIDLATVQGTGPHGRVVKRDLEGREATAATAAPAKVAPAPLLSGERLPPRIEKASPTRKTIARRLGESKRDVPHYYLTIDVDAGPVLEARAAINESLDGEKVSVNDLVVKAVALALRKSPNVNASWMGDEIHYHQVVDISVAVAIPDGLVTPVVRDADRKGLLAISREVKELAGKAKDKRLRPEEISGGTFSISNLGMYGIDEFAAVINPPEGAILAVGTVRDEPVVEKGQVVAGKKMKLTLSADHRVVDGAVAAQFLKTLRGLLEQPLSMLL